MFDAKRHALHTEERAGQLDAGRKRMLTVLGRGMHHTKQARPIDLRCAPQLPGTRVAQSWQISGIKSVTEIVQTAPACAAKHLEKFVRFHLALEVAGEIASFSHNH